MPRLHHLADANPFDFYDSIALLARDVDIKALRAGGIRLFGNCNVGLQHRSNVQVAGRLSSDQTAMIQNLYARTNLWVEIGSAIEAALSEWAHATSVTLIVGDKPQRQAPLSNLLSRMIGQRDADAIPLDEAAAYFEDLARGIWFDTAFLDATVDESIKVRVDLDGNPRTWRSVHSSDASKASDASWTAMPADIKQSWVKIAHAAHRRLKSPQITIVPPRQNVSVLVQSDERALVKLLEIIPPGISPMPLVWIHLEGVARRDVC
jgi:hypothetical protein